MLADLASLQFEGILQPSMGTRDPNEATWCQTSGMKARLAVSGDLITGSIAVAMPQHRGSAEDAGSQDHQGSQVQAGF